MSAAHHHSNNVEGPRDDLEWFLVPCQPKDPEYHVAATQPLQLGRSRRLPRACRLDDSRISGLHCIFEVDPVGTLMLTDRSANGIFVNGRKVGKGRATSLAHGDIIDLTKPTALDGDGSTSISYVVRGVPESVLRASELVTIDGEDLDAMVNNYQATLNNAILMEDREHPMHTCYSPPDPFSVVKRAQSPFAQEATPLIASTSTFLKPFRQRSRSRSPSHPPAPPQRSRKRRKKAADTPSTVKLEENLTCAICRHVFHRPVSCVPCMHSYCAGCFSQWMARHKECPRCRLPVTEVRHNPVLRQVAEEYLNSHPEFRRSAIEQAELDEHNTILDEEQPVKVTSEDGADAGADADDTDDSGSEATEVEVEKPSPGPWSMDSVSPWPGMRLVPPFGSGSVVFAGKCRACIQPDNYGYLCPPAAAPHHTCAVCQQLFPAPVPPPVPTQCGRCGLFFCDAYWGCLNVNGAGVLRRLREHQLTSLPPGALGGNAFEVEVLLGYLCNKGRTVENMWVKCLERLPAWHVLRSDVGWTTFPEDNSSPEENPQTTADNGLPLIDVDAVEDTASKSNADEEGPDLSQEPEVAEPNKSPEDADQLPTTEVPEPSGNPQPEASPEAPEGPQENQENEDAQEAQGNQRKHDPPDEAVPELPDDSAAAPVTDIQQMQEEAMDEVPVAPPVRRAPPYLTGDHICCRKCAEEVFAALIFLYRLEVPSSKLPMSIRGRPYCWHGKDCLAQKHDAAHCRQFNHACFGVQ